MRHIGEVLSSLGRTADTESMSEAEIKARVRQCARLIAQWPQARIGSVDATLYEYVNATRGVPLRHLHAIIDAARDAGGEFLPPAGTILERAARFLAQSRPRTYNPAMPPEQAIADETWELTRELRTAQREAAPLLLEDVSRALLGSGDGPRIGPGDDDFDGAPL